MENIFNVVIIGAGSIGALKDSRYDNPDNPEQILTHAHAFSEHPSFNLFGIIDVDSEKALKAHDKWGFDSVSTGVKFFHGKVVDVVVIATPTLTHKKVLSEVLHYLNPKVIVLEKPVGSTIKETEEIEEIVRVDAIMNDRSYIIDYIRRFVYQTREIKQAIEKNLFGTIYDIVIRYTRGIRHEACHAIDMVCNLLGIQHQDELEIKILPYQLKDGHEGDPSLTVHMVHDKCKNIVFLPSDGKHHSIFEIEIHCDAGKFILENHGALLRHIKVVQEKIYGNYYNLDSDYFKVEKTNIHTALFGLTENVLGCINKTQEPECSISDAVLVQQILENIMKKHNG